MEYDRAPCVDPPLLSAGGRDPVRVAYEAKAQRVGPHFVPPGVDLEHFDDELATATAATVLTGGYAAAVTAKASETGEMAPPDPD